MQTSRRMCGKVVAWKERLKHILQPIYGLQRGELTQGGYRGKLMSVSDQFVIGLVELGEWHN
jgi:hypothetical protein